METKETKKRTENQQKKEKPKHTTPVNETPFIIPHLNKTQHPHKQTTKN